MDSTPYEIFSNIFDDEVINLLVTQTNLYYEQYLIEKGDVDNLPAYTPSMKVGRCFLRRNQSILSCYIIHWIG